MENGSNAYTGQSNRNSGTNAGLVWDMWESNANNTSRLDWANTSNAGESSSTSTALMLPHPSLYHYEQFSVFGGQGSNYLPDPHLMCLKLGKRHYFEDAITVGERQVASSCFSIGKRGKPYDEVVGSRDVGPSSSAAVVARCQVEGCHVALVNAKEYHRRHKVCEMHSKAPKAIVLGLEQRFCQQCSRFHVVAEFDDAKRSCRRRLAGHNERRRKSTHDSVSTKVSCQDELMGGRFQLLASSTGRALSLLSSNTDSWVSSSDLSSRSSAALRELIAEHRAAIFARQVVLERHLLHNNTSTNNNSYNNSIQDSRDHDHHRHQHISNDCFIPNHPQIIADHPQHWDRFHASGTQLTLDLIQAPNSAFRIFPARGNTNKKEQEEECSALWTTWAASDVD